MGNWGGGGEGCLSLENMSASDRRKTKNDPETEPFSDWVANFLFTLAKHPFGVDTAVYR